MFMSPRVVSFIEEPYTELEAILEFMSLTEKARPCLV